MLKIRFKHIVRSAAVLIFGLSLTQFSFGYSVLTHEAIIDSTWEGSIKPILLARFPHATPDQLRQAHAHAYGGAIIQDMGYYPFGSKFYTDLVHYVRSGDFVEELLAEAKDLDEYAFALGALAHYVADTNGHPIGVNRAVPILYPKLRTKFGDRVTYVEDPSAHLKTEFGFDVVQLARGRYARDSYHDYIGFKVAKSLLERAFKKTYDIELKELFISLDLALGTYRRAVSSVIPEMTKVAWETKKDDIEKINPGITREKFVYQLSRAEYEKEWGKEYSKPGAWDKTLSLFFRVVPKVGPFATLSFKTPTPEAERVFLESFNETLTRYRAVLGRVRTGKLNLANRDFDTGEPTSAGEYALADETYAELLHKLEKNKFEGVSPELRQDILGFYRDLSVPIATKKDKSDWQETLRAIEGLRGGPSNPTRADRQR